MKDYPHSDANRPRSRVFENKIVVFDESKFIHCKKNNPVVKLRKYFVKRQDETDRYVYYATELLTDHNGKPTIAKDHARALAYGTKDGKCTLDFAPQGKWVNGKRIQQEPPGIDEDCGFEAQVLKFCIQDRGKPSLNPLSKKPGFNPTKGPDMWQNADIAKKAAQNCDLIIQSEVANFKPPAKGDDKIGLLLREMVFIADAASEAELKAGSMTSFNKVFVDVKGARNKMVITNMATWRLLFPDIYSDASKKFTTRVEDYAELLREILPRVFFCACPPKKSFCATINSESDPKTDTLIKNLIDIEILETSTSK